MTIIEREIVATKLEHRCDHCGVGVYRFNGNSIKTTNPMQYEHSCSNCSKTAFFTFIFPVIKYKDRDFMLADPMRVPVEKYKPKS